MKEKIHITVCTGTACFVMGGSELVMLEEHLPAAIKDQVEISGSACLGFCKQATTGKAPFVKIDGVVMNQASVPKILDYLDKNTSIKQEKP
jgi:NADH:ubiquinone oxidoreductase subunit E